MSNATELLRRAVRILGRSQDDDAEDLFDEICDFLEAEKEAEPVFIRPDHLALARKSPFLCQVGPVQVADFVPLYARPEPTRKPMTDEECEELIMEDYRMEEYFSAAVGLIRRVEKHNGIGGSDADT